jgi:hypothetical protein
VGCTRLRGKSCPSNQSHVSLQPVESRPLSESGYTASAVAESPLRVAEQSKNQCSRSRSCSPSLLLQFYLPVGRAEAPSSITRNLVMYIAERRTDDPLTLLGLPAEIVTGFGPMSRENTLRSEGECGVMDSFGGERYRKGMRVFHMRRARDGWKSSEG